MAGSQYKASLEQKGQTTNADTEIPLTYFSIGIWNQRTRGPISISLLLLHSSQQFVFLLDKTATAQVAHQGIRRVFQRLTASSPFKSSPAFAGSVLAFEVDWKHVVGMDYSNPLCLPGRLVLEAHQVAKREFCSDVWVHYNLTTTPAYHRQASAPSFRSLDVTGTCSAATNPGRLCARPISAGHLQELDSTGFGTGKSNYLSGGPSPGEQVRSSWLHREWGGRTDSRQRGAATSGTSNPGFDLDDSAGRKAQGNLSAKAAFFSGARNVDSLSNWPHTESSPAPDERSCDGGSGAKVDGERQGKSAGTPSEAGATSFFKSRSITCNFEDPSVPGGLRPAIQGDERLLKLYESGLPAWAIYAPQYGIWYRPWMRRVTYALFILVSTFSLVMGFYDLYKNVPYLDQFLRQVVSAYLPSTAILQWLDEHVSFRLSILCAYLFGKSEIAVQLLRWLGAAASFCRAALQPIVAVLGPPLAAHRAMLHQSGRQVAAAASAFILMVKLAAEAVFGPPFASLLGALLFLHQLLKPVVQVVSSVCSSMVLGPWTALRLCAASAAASVVAAARTAMILGKAAAAAWHAVKTGTRMTPVVASSAAELGAQMKSWYVVVPLEALEVVKNSTVKVIRALQTLSRLCTQVASDIARHRLTLKLRLHRNWVRFKEKLTRLVPLFLLAFWRRLSSNKQKTEDVHGNGAVAPAEMAEVTGVVKEAPDTEVPSQQGEVIAAARAEARARRRHRSTL